MSEKRFVVENGNNEVSIKDKVEDNYPFALAYEHIDDADNLIQECLSLVGLLNEQQATIEQLQEENKELKYWKKRIIEYLTDWFNKTDILTVLYKINEIRSEIGLDNDE